MSSILQNNYLQYIRRMAMATDSFCHYYPNWTLKGFFCAPLWIQKGSYLQDPDLDFSAQNPNSNDCLLKSFITIPQPQQVCYRSLIQF